MLNIDYSPDFLKTISKIKNKDEQERIRKQIKRTIENPEVGKPMHHSRKGTREVYVKPFKFSYAYVKEEEKIILLDFLS